MLSCDEVMGLLSGFTTGKLEPPQAEEVQLHLKSCKSCPRVVNMCGVWVIEERDLRRRASRTAVAGSAA